jgi:hypothetical protein
LNICGTNDSAQQATPTTATSFLDEVVGEVDHFDDFDEGNNGI